MNKKVNAFQGKQTMEVSVSDFVLRNKVTGVESFVDSVESQTLSKTVQTEKIKAGIQNNTLCTIDGETETTLEIVDVLKRPELILLGKWGGKEKSGVITKTVFPNNYTVETEKKITLPQQPINTSDIVVYKGEKALESGNYSVSGKEITITDDSVNVGDNLFITSFEYTAESSTYYDMGEGSNSTTFEILEKKPVFDLNMNIIQYKYTHYPKCRMSTEVEESGETSRTKQTNTYSFSVEKDQNYNYLFRVWLEDVVE